jgi:hypothetical protein
VGASVLDALGLCGAQELDVFVGQQEGEREALVWRHRGQSTAFSRAQVFGHRPHDGIIGDECGAGAGGKISPWIDETPGDGRSCGCWVVPAPCH